MFIRHIQTPLGPLTIGASNKGLVSANFANQNQQEEHSSPILEEAARQVTDWFAGNRSVFDLPLDLRGTDFQKAVWEQLLAIPRGQYRTYGSIAQSLDNPGASRAVGGACGANPLVLIIPCHRVLAGDGKLGGFSSGLELKRQLLKMEGIEWK